jgi:cell division protein FtsW
MIARLKKKKEPSKKKNRLFWIFFFPVLLSLIGLLFVFEASSVKSFNEYGDSFHYFKLQLIWICLGVAVMTFFSVFDYHKLYYLAFLFMMSTIVLLCIVLIPGLGHKAGGAQRWIDLGVINFQPTELAKFSVIIYLSSWFIYKERKRFLSFMLLLGILMLLIILQPDMGTAIIVFCLSIIIYFLAGVDLHYLMILLPGALAGFYVLIKTSPYRFRRLLAFFDPALDPQGITYHVNQILISLSNGGIFGRGFGSSRQKYLFLPEAHTDSIFAIIGEEVGFFGCILLIAMLIILLYKIYEVVLLAPDRYGRLLSGGILGYFGLQIIINLGGMVNLFPLTGVPLPFFSYGGSNLLTSFAFIGILVNIARKKV